MALCGLCRKGLQEQFVAKSNGAEYVCCSNRACGYFCSLDKLSTYKRVVQLDVASTFGTTRSKYTPAEDKALFNFVARYQGHYPATGNKLSIVAEA